MTGTRTGRLLDHNILANQPTGGILNKLNLYDQYTGKINDPIRTSDSWVCEIPPKFLEKTGYGIGTGDRYCKLELRIAIGDLN